MEKEIIRVLKDNDLLKYYPIKSDEINILRKLIEAKCINEYIINRKEFLKNKSMTYSLFWRSPMSAFHWNKTKEGKIFWLKIYQTYFK